MDIILDKIFNDIVFLKNKKINISVMCQKIFYYFQDYYKIYSEEGILKKSCHISDTIEICLKAWKLNRCRHYSISHKKSYSIKDVAKMFGSKIRYLPPRSGERYASALTNMAYNNKVRRYYGKINLKDYVSSFIKNKKFKL